ncbi:chaperonin-containing T-complex alpha subunit [Starmerella bacillaris]|uniref:T-complex protein 1 subunit alpha n=1 Tax=Starmerella bacillaris TaxID=1247836 RepID=A0AAV5RI77_STABA|nr:chaperonin-containing T-complex alpha subunit [Starmerella bacillaris]
MFAPSKSDTLFLNGERIHGDDVRNQNVMACLALANVVKSSLGPVGLDKFLVDDIGDVTVTNDGATILSLLDVKHPAGEILVQLAHQQDREVGDGTTSVVIFATELLRRANELVKNKIHPTTIINGYRLALKEAANFVTQILSTPTAQLGKPALVNIAKTSIASKIVGGADADFFSQMAVDAILAVKTTNSRGEVRYPTKAVNILKAHGRSSKESQLVHGYAINCTVATRAMPLQTTDGARIACLDINLQKARMNLGVQIKIDDPEQLEAIRKREIGIVSEQIDKVLKAGANVVFTTKGIDDMCLKLFVEKGVMAVRRVKREDLRRVAKATGASFVTTMSNMNGDEVFEKEWLGHADSVRQVAIGDNECIVVEGTKVHSSSSLILRGSNEFQLDEMERSIYDALSVVKRTLETGAIVAGGGCVETALSIFLETFATTLSSREQVAISEFAMALLVIPKTLTINAAKDSTDLVAKLRSYHAASQSAPSTDLKRRNYKNYGLDLFKGKCVDQLANGVIEPSMSKIKSLRSAVEACIAILRIDTMIVVNPDQPAEDPHGH